MSAEYGVTTSPASETSADHEFERLFLEHYPRLVQILVRLVGNSGQAEELASDAFFRFHGHRAEIGRMTIPPDGCIEPR